MQKSKKKEEKIILYGTFSLAVFLFSVTKRAKKRMWFCFFSVRGEGKCEINYKKNENFFSLLWRAFSLFLVVSFPEKMIRKCFGGKEKE